MGRLYFNINTEGKAEANSRTVCQGDLVRGHAFVGDAKAIHPAATGVMHSDCARMMWVADGIVRDALAEARFQVAAEMLLPPAVVAEKREVAAASQRVVRGKGQGLDFHRGNLYRVSD